MNHIGFNNVFNQGNIEVIVSNMFSGKTDHLIKRRDRALKYANIPVTIIKPTIDTKGGDDVVTARIEQDDGTTIEKQRPCRSFKTSWGMYHHFNKRIPQLILSDESQFWDKSIHNIAQLLVRLGHNIVFYGLPRDFRKQPFGYIPQLMAVATRDPIFLKEAVCSVDNCYNDGVNPQRLHFGEPDDAFSPTVIIDGSDDDYSYEPRCEKHHIVKRLEKWLTTISG